MSHEIDMTLNRPAIAFRGELPWHGLGFQMEGNETMEMWRERAGLGWDAVAAPVQYAYENPNAGKITNGCVEAKRIINTVAKKVVLYRNDTGDALGIVGENYKIVQPGTIMDFYQDLASSHGFEMETAGSLFAGRIIWALARTGNSLKVMGDQVDEYVLMSTSFDGSKATTIRQTSVRVVCNNTLSLAMSRSQSKRDQAAGAKIVTVSHRSLFDADATKIKLGFDRTAMDKLAVDAQAMAERRVTPEESVAFFLKVYHNMTAAEVVKAQVEKTTDKTIARLAEHFMHAPGSELKSAHGTAWGLLNAVTYDLDHVLGRSPDSRLDSAWYGQGATRKQAAYEAALELALA